MSVAEYISAFVSIIIGLALADLVMSLQRLLRAGRRIVWDGLAPLGALLTVSFVINVWWTMYGELLRVNRLSVSEFIPELISLLLLFSIASSALPDEVPAEGLSLEVYYEKNRRWFWRIFALYIGWITIVAASRGIMSGMPLANYAGTLIPNVAMGILMLILSSTARRRIHYLIIILLLLVTGLAWLPQEVAEAPAQASGRTQSSPRVP